MDKIDKQILFALQKNANLPLSELSKRVGISKTPCWNRIRKMEEEGIINSRVTVLDNKKLNLNIVVFLSVSVSSHSEEWLTDFQTILSQYDKIINKGVNKKGGKEKVDRKSAIFIIITNLCKDNP